MHKLLSVTTKFLTFFIGWALCIGFDIPSDNPAVWRLGAEAIPLVVIAVFSIIYWLIEKKKFPVVILTNRPLKSIAEGVVLGGIWLASAVLILPLLHAISFVGINSVSMLSVWMFSCFLNTVMQELLVRGYLYQLIKYEYSGFVAIVVTTILFTLMHGGAFEAGVIPVLNVVTMSVLMSVAMEYTHSILVPIMMHFIWNAVGSIILGGVSLACDYPTLLQLSYSSNTLLSGGACKIEGSVVVLLLNIFFIVLLSAISLQNKKEII